MYETHGRFPNGKSFDEQEETFWRQLVVTQRMNAYELQQLSGDNYTMADDADVVEEPEPPPMTLDMM